jgi:RNA polymerase sigma-70 factor (ECF subfamily)
MLLNAARLASRIDAEGNLLRLQEQDRAIWDQSMIARGMYHLTQSATGAEMSEYHLQAGIAACHCAAKNYGATDWRRILELYDRLIQSDASPVIALNRAVALAEVHGAEAGIEAVGKIANSRSLQSYYLFHAVLGEFELRLRQFDAAAGHFGNALRLASMKSERAFLEQRLKDCEERRGGKGSEK